MKVELLNTATLTHQGTFALNNMPLELAKKVIEEYGFHSHISDKRTAEIMSTLLGIDVPVNREPFTGEIVLALILNLNGIPEEGKILTVEEIEKIGYQFMWLCQS